MAKLYLGTREITPAIYGGGGSAPAHYIEKTVDANGKLHTSTNFINMSGVSDVGDFVLCEAYRTLTFPSNTSMNLSSLTTLSGTSACQDMFAGCSGITGVDISSLTTISGNGACNSMFLNNYGITSVDISSLTTISGQNACAAMFQNCSGITSVDISSLTTISGNSACCSMFRLCSALTSITLSSLTTISGNSACQNMFTGCVNLQSVSYPALTTNAFGSFVTQFQNMMTNTGSTTTHTLHFPSNLQTVISGLTGYPTFGGTSGYVVCAFDLPATT